MTMASQAFLSTAAPRSKRASCRGVVRPAFNLLKVQAMGGDVLRNRGRHLAFDRSPFLDVLPDLARRDVRRPHQAEGDAIAIQARGVEVGLLRRAAARTRDHSDR